MDQSCGLDDRNVVGFVLFETKIAAFLFDRDSEEDLYPQDHEAYEVVDSRSFFFSSYKRCQVSEGVIIELREACLAIVVSIARIDDT